MTPADGWCSERVGARCERRNQPPRDRTAAAIHIAPENLTAAYRRLYECARKYVCVVEYYNPAPVEVSYRGHAARLWKRDFAGELLDAYPALRLLDYGFVYRRDTTFAADDLTWFLLERR